MVLAKTSATSSSQLSPMSSVHSPILGLGEHHRLRAVRESAPRYPLRIGLPFLEVVSISLDGRFRGPRSLARLVFRIPRVGALRRATARFGDPTTRIASRALNSCERGAGEAEKVRDRAPAQTGRRKQVSERNRHRRIKQILSREESTPGKPIPYAAWSDPRGEA